VSPGRAKLRDRRYAAWLRPASSFKGIKRVEVPDERIHSM
jgi:hypothetical protein